MLDIISIERERMPSDIRPLHFVFKIANRTKTIDFYKNILNMKVLRHEEFEQGCDAACNGPYDGKWSKTMIGYGAEDSNFVLELTYNYGVREYERGNDFNHIKIVSSVAYKRLSDSSYPFQTRSDGLLQVADPDGYTFLVGKHEDETTNILSELSLYITDPVKSKLYWSDLLKGQVVDVNSNELSLRFDHLDYFRLRLVKSSSEAIDHSKAYGRVAFSCPTGELKALQALIEEHNHKVLTPYIQLDTPGKATVSVVILADPNGHEICFVGDQEFRSLSQVDEKADELISEAIQNDKSDEWHAKRAAKNQ